MAINPIGSEDAGEKNFNFHLGKSPSFTESSAKAEGQKRERLFEGMWAHIFIMLLQPSFGGHNLQGFQSTKRLCTCASNRRWYQPKFHSAAFNGIFHQRGKSFLRPWALGILWWLTSPSHFSISAGRSRIPSFIAARRYERFFMFSDVRRVFLSSWIPVSSSRSVFCLSGFSATQYMMPESADDVWCCKLWLFVARESVQSESIPSKILSKAMTVANLSTFCSSFNQKLCFLSPSLAVLLLHFP